MISAPERTSGHKWLRAQAVSQSIGVDREAKRINGMVIAQEGPFKSRRGEFDQKSLKAINSMIRAMPKGLKSRLSHPDESNDGIGKALGRVENPRLGVVHVRHDGEIKELMAVRGDLQLLDASFKTPNGDLGGYVLDLAEEDPDMFSSSLVLQADEEWRLDKKGRPLTDDAGHELPPIWRPTALHASDVVDTGDAVDGFLGHCLSVDGLPNEVVYKATKLLKQQFAGKSREFVEERLRAYVERALEAYFPPATDDEPPPEVPRNAETLARILMLSRRQMLTR